MKRVLTLTACIVLLTLNAWSQAVPLNEETMIRSFYGQLAYLTQVKVASDAAINQYSEVPIDKTKLAQQFSQAEVQLALSDFKTGPLSEIANQRSLSVASPIGPSRQMLYIQVGVEQFTNNDLLPQDWRTATAKWEPSHVMSPEAMSQLGDFTVHQLLTMPENASVFGKNVYTRYATFTVSVTFQGQTSSGKAIAFFGTDAKGTWFFTPQNPILDFGGSLPSEGASFYPKGLMRTQLRETPVLADWFASQAISASSCTAVKHTLCCSGSRCGVSVTDLQEELSTPLTPLPDKSTN
jgi:hypothetical protein